MEFGSRSGSLMKKSLLKIQTAFTKQFNIPYPIVCAPMFLVSNVEMVVATGNAGGMGTFPAFNFRPIEKYEQAIREIKKKTKAPFGINIIAQKTNKYQHEQLEIALSERVPLIISSLGSPRDIIKKAHKAGTKVYCDVVGIEHAKKVADLGADGLVAVSAGAGGHAGDTSPFALIPQLKEHLTLPVLAAGSIVNGRGMLAALGLGADGIYMGTRFIASKEGGVSAGYKKAIIKASAEDIVNTDRVDGFPGNFILTKELKDYGVKSGFIESLAKQNKKLARWLAMGRAAKSLFASDTSKASYKTIFSAGHGVGMIHSVQPIKKIIENTIKEYNFLKKKLP